MSVSLRQNDILDLARREGKVTVEGLARRFGVTVQTARRDLNALCETGALDRVYGGAVAAAGSAVANIGYQERRALNAAAKEAIGRACAAAIPDGASLFLNIGTTTEAVARALSGHRGLMVVTNNINVANILAGSAETEIIVAGGVLRRADGGLVGEAAADFIRMFKVDYAVIGASALDADGDLLDYDFREVRVSQAIIAAARKSYLVADASKFSRAAPVRIASLADLDALFTEAPPPGPVARLCAEAGTAVQLCGVS